ncbi:MAG: 3-methyladenine DNA glycosylase [Cereibacter sphaeroides]|uniref:3-methyladenine DNA glycosylase n=1 Tax=Cereibacter sphaeroides TaxID=1063 RepID=A0A2W5S5Z0_CERSP|nr:MAG: 3-methyladenine DNA glycosylase [Cereibacter sphaeroides]
MRTFAEILKIAAERKGGADAVLKGAPVPKKADELAAIPDDRWLAAMARGIFQAGISWKVVDNKWEGIEEAFLGFDPGRVSMMEGEAIDALVSDTRVIRSGPKIVAIRDNAVFIRQVAGQAGSFGRKVGDWPTEDFAGLLDWLSTNGSRLGGTTGPYMLRYMGKEGFILGRDVVARLIAEGVISGPPGSKKALVAVQSAFNAWKAESGRSLTEISRVLAQSIDG